MLIPDGSVFASIQYIGRGFKPEGAPIGIWETSDMDSSDVGDRSGVRGFLR